MARTVNYAQRAEKIKKQIDELAREVNSNRRRDVEVPKEKIKASDFDFAELDLNTLIQLQAKISRFILEKSK